MRLLVFSVLIGFISGFYLFEKDIQRKIIKSENQKTKFRLSEDELRYFDEITLKNELNSRVKNSPRKYKKDVRIYIYGNPEEYMVREIMDVVSDLNYIIDPIDISLVKNRSESNISVFFGDYNSFISNNLDLIRVQELKSCEGFFTCKSNGSNEITSSRVFINLPNQDGIDDVRDVIREEITQSIGFFNDGTTHPESCFHNDQNKIFEYSDIDIKLIKHLYNE